MEALPVDGDGLAVGDGLALPEPELVDDRAGLGDGELAAGLPIGPALRVATASVEVLFVDVW